MVELMSLRIAMWSGPRNISTAMMRSWGNRPDTAVCDEPFYAHYLQQTQLEHPGHEETIAQHETDWRKVVEQISGEAPGKRAIFYQKQMSHHMLPEIELDWLERVNSCFLIRSPREMLTSLLEFLPQPTLQDTGLPQQVRIFDLVRSRRGDVPPVLDARDVLLDPGKMLAQLCKKLGVAFSESMLQWPPGLRETDGAWAKHWYAKVEQTTRFAPYRPKEQEVPRRFQGLLAECEELYEQLFQHRLKS